MPREPVKRLAFEKFLIKELKAGRIPGPKACNTFLGLNHYGAHGSMAPFYCYGNKAGPEGGVKYTNGKLVKVSGDTMTSRWTAVRRRVFTEYGLVYITPRWYFRDDAEARIARLREQGKSWQEIAAMIPSEKDRTRGTSVARAKQIAGL